MERTVGKQRDLSKYLMVLKTVAKIKSTSDTDEVDKQLREVIDRSVRRRRFIRRSKEYEYFTHFYPAYKSFGRWLYCFVSREK